jgi:hypothetical protein
MRQSVVKRLRKQVYGDLSTKRRKYARGSDGRIMCMDRRTLFQNAKKDYKAGRQI